MSEYVPDNPVSALKVPPHSLEAEQSVLGGLMLDDQAWFDLIEVVAATDFYRTQHQIIFDAMNELASDDAPLDAVTVSERLSSKGLLEKPVVLATWPNWQSRRPVPVMCWLTEKSCVSVRFCAS